MLQALNLEPYKRAGVICCDECGRRRHAAPDQNSNFRSVM